MNKTLALVATMAISLGLASQVQAQSATKVGFVNIGVVFTKYEKAKTFKVELEGAVKEIKASIDTLGKQIMAWQEEIKKPGFPEKERERYEAGIRNNKRQIEDLQLQAQKKIGKRQEEQLIVIYKEIVGATQGYASANGFHALLAYGDPTDQNDLFNVMNIDRKLKGMDMGGVVPLYFDRTLDVSEAIVGNLNAAFRQAGGGGTTLPNSGGNVIPVGTSGKN